MSHREALGRGFFVVAAILFFSFYLLNRTTPLRIKMGSKIKGTVTVDSLVIRQAVDACFTHHFPHRIRLNEVQIARGSKLSLDVTLAPLDEAAREELFIALEMRLKTLFKEKFGFTKPFFLLVSDKH